MLRDDYQTGLQQAEATGHELLERYGDAPEAVARTLNQRGVDRLLERRETLLARLARQSRQRGDLPAGGNVERAQLSALADRLSGGADADAGVLMRLLDAEREYRADLDELLELDWSDAERETLVESREVVDRLIEHLEVLTASSD